MLTDYHWSSTDKKLWKGFELIAGDGTTVSLPPSQQIKDHFGIYSTTANGTHNVLAQVFMLYDVYSDVVLSGKIDKMEHSEKTLFKDILDQFPSSKAIFILDRGFGYFNVCKKMILQHRDFCIRIDNAHSGFAKMIMENPSNDFLTDWVPSDRERNTSVRNGLDKLPIKVRVTKIRLKGGTLEVLISSLYDMVNYTLNDIEELYRLRWGIEEGFKKLKPKMKLEHFGARKPMGIYQEFEAHLFMMNLIAIIGKAAQRQINKQCVNRKLNYKYNWQNAYRFVRVKLGDLIKNLRLNQSSLNQVIKLFISSLIPIKDNRSFPRNDFRKNKSRQYQCYK